MTFFKKYWWVLLGLSLLFAYAVYKESTALAKFVFGVFAAIVIAALLGVLALSGEWLWFVIASAIWVGGYAFETLIPAGWYAFYPRQSSGATTNFSVTDGGLIPAVQDNNQAEDQ